MPSLLDLFVRITADQSEYKKALKDAKADTTAFADLAEAAGARIATSLSFVGLAAGAVGAAAKFEQAQFQIQRATGATGAQLANLEDSFKHLYVNTGKGPEEVAGALSQLTIRTGLTGAALESLATTSLRFAKVTGSDLQTSVRENERLFAQWGIATQDQAQALDVLYVASQRSGKSTAELTGTLSGLGATLRAYGYSFKDAVALIGTFERAGLDATNMARGLNAMFAKMATSGKDPQAELQRLIESLNNTSSATDAAAKLIELGFSRRAVVAMQDALRRGALDISTFRAALDKSAGAVDDMAKKTEGLGEKWTKLLHNLQVVGTPPGKLFLDLLSHGIEGLVNWIKDAQKYWDEFVNHVKQTEPQTIQDFDAKMAAIYGKDYQNRQDSTGRIAQAMRQQFVLTHPQTGQSLNQGAGGGGAATYSTEEISKDLSTLGVRDLTAERDAMVAALNRVTEAGKLTTAQMEEVRDKILALDDLINAAPPAFIKYADATRAFVAQTNPVMSATEIWVNALQTMKAVDAKIEAPRQLFGTAEYDKLDATGKALDAIGIFLQKLDPKELKETEATLARLGVIAPAVPDDVRAIDDAMRALGVTGKTDIPALTAHMNTLGAALKQNAITQEDYNAALVKYVQDLRAAGQQIDPHIRKLYDQIQAQKQLADRIRETGLEMARAFSGGFQNIERGLADIVFNGGKVFQKLADIGKRTAEDIFASFLHGLFKPFEDQLTKLGQKFGEWLGSIWGIGSKAGSAAGSIYNLPTSAATVPWFPGTSVPTGGVTSGAGGAASAASSSLTGVLTSIFSGISAVTGVVGMFQSSETNKSLDVLADHTLRIFNVEQQIHDQMWDMHYGVVKNLSMIFDRLGDIWATLREGGSSGSHITINAQADISDIIRQLKAQGVFA